MNQEGEFLAELVNRFWVNPQSETADFLLRDGTMINNIMVRTAVLVNTAKALGFRGSTPHYGSGYYWRPAPCQEALTVV